MNTHQLLNAKNPGKALIAFIICLAILLAAVLMASQVQQSFGKTVVTNVTYENDNGILIRAKLLKPVEASSDQPVPGAVYIHGYQNNRETSDAYCLELARRGIAVLNIDSIGRGNSGIPTTLDDPGFDHSFGGRKSLEYLKSLPFIKDNAIAMMGHSLGAEIAYNIALENPNVAALVISGFAYRKNATFTRPRNMLMIFGKYDEYRDRMTETLDFEAEWMNSPQTRQAISATQPEFGVTYGRFENGTARRVFMPRVTHIQESHNAAAIAEALTWLQNALHPDTRLWIPPEKQIWQIKEWATLVAMLAGFATLLPLGLILLRTGFWGELQGPFSGNYACRGKAYAKAALINGLLMWLYLPLIFVLFGIHIYVVHIDKAFPLMMANGVLWWFFAINIIGFFFVRRWYRKSSLNLYDVGVSFGTEKFQTGGVKMLKTVFLAGVLIAFVYLCEHLLETVFIVDYRFIFPFASDLTAYRASMCLRYFPFILIGFLLLGGFIHGQMRRPPQASWLRTFITWSVTNVLLLIVPLIILLMVQYIPLFTVGAIPFVGPGGMFVSFVLGLFHIIIVLLIVLPISTFFYQITGKIYLGALINAAIVTWMFMSSQVIAPIPV